MTHPHAAGLLRAQGPILLTATATVQQQGTAIDSVCVNDYIFRVAWTYAGPTAGHTISIDTGWSTSNPPTKVSWQTGLAIGSSPADQTIVDEYFDAGGVQMYYAATVKIIRTSDGLTVSSIATNVITSEKTLACL